jgi:hypothetical protein
MTINAARWDAGVGAFVWDFSALSTNYYYLLMDSTGLMALLSTDLSVTENYYKIASCYWDSVGSQLYKTFGGSVGINDERYFGVISADDLRHDVNNKVYIDRTVNVGINAINPQNVNATGKIQEKGIDLIASGTVVIFAQATAPVGWTQLTTGIPLEGRMLRVVSGTGGTDTGSEHPSTHAHDTIAVHQHALFYGGFTGGNPTGYPILQYGSGTGYCVSSIGGGGAFNALGAYTAFGGGHTHSGYLPYTRDVIVASKD